MSRSISRWFVLAPIVAVVLVGRAVRAEQFVIDIDQPVSDGVPGPGAGVIESPGGSDQYLLETDVPLTIYVDELFGNCLFKWTLTAPDGAIVFSDGAFCSTDPGVKVLDAPGTYSFTVTGTGAATGAYSFVVWSVEAPQVFTIGIDQTVASGVPGPGAGVLEEPGSIDEYELEIADAAAVYFDELAGPCAIAWKAAGPGGVQLFSDLAMCSTDPGVFLLEPGAWTITVTSPSGGVGGYSFKVWSVPPPESFAIDLEEVVAPGSPAPGAGVLESPGAIDEYLIDLAAGTSVYFDEKAGGCGIRWKLVAPGGMALFDDFAICGGEPGVIDIAQTGPHTIVVYGIGGASGSYSFATWLIDPPQEFAIALGDIVSPGVPGRGAGVLEEPGSVDLYHLPAVAGTLVYFDELAGICLMRWRLIAPSGAVFFEDSAMCSTDPGEVLLGESGLWTIEVFSLTDGTGSYSFSVQAVSPPQFFPLLVDQVVSEGVPATGAGSLEEPGAADVYLLDLPAGADICFVELDGPCGIMWTALPPEGAPLFEDPYICAINPGRFVGLGPGTYSIWVTSAGGDVGSYSFVVLPGQTADLDGDCAVAGGDLGMLLAAWGDCDPLCAADLDGDGVVGGADLGMLLAAWGDPQSRR